MKNFLKIASIVAAMVVSSAAHADYTEPPASFTAATAKAFCGAKKPYVIVWAYGFTNNYSEGEPYLAALVSDCMGMGYVPQGGLTYSNSKVTAILEQAMVYRGTADGNTAQMIPRAQGSAPRQQH